MTINLFKKIKIVIDTREKNPWYFPEHLVTSSRGKLKTGDYAIKGDSNFAIERKSLEDFIGTIATEERLRRFQRELERMNGWSAKTVIIEADFKDVCFYKTNNQIVVPQHKHYKLSAQFIMSLIAQLSLRGASIFFAGDKGIASALCYHVLKKRQLDFDNEN